MFFGDTELEKTGLKAKLSENKQWSLMTLYGSER